MSELHSVTEKFGREVSQRGFAGPTDTPALVYLAFLSALLDKPVSMVLMGPSGAGKSFALNAAKQFVPSRAFDEYQGMSEKAIAYLGLDLKNRTLVIGEASGMADGQGRTLLRQLLSEGAVRYATVESTEHGLRGKETPTLEGPCNVIMTTTAGKIHPEDASRMLLVNVTESPDQIEAALVAQALGTSGSPEPIDQDYWFGLYDEIAKGPRKVEIPFAADLARRLPKSHDRIKRDFPQVLSLLKVHALLHASYRERNGEAVIASRSDYEVIHRLVDRLLSDQLDKAVPDHIRRVVEGVETISRGNNSVSSISQAKLADHIGRDRSSVSRAVKTAVEGGYLRQEGFSGQGREDRLTLGEVALPDSNVLPHPDELFGSLPPVGGMHVSPPAKDTALPW